MDVSNSPKENCETQKLTKAYERINGDAWMPYVFFVKQVGDDPAAESYDSIGTKEDDEQAESPSSVAHYVRIASIEFKRIGSS